MLEIVFSDSIKNILITAKITIKKLLLSVLPAISVKPVASKIKKQFEDKPTGAIRLSARGVAIS